jgi:deoxyribose-phosphate aldolase
MSYTKEQIATALDLAVLSPIATPLQIADAGQLVKQRDIHSLCVASGNVRLARQFTSRVTAVVGFPHGNISQEAKVEEAEEASWERVDEIDVVLNYGRLLAGDCDPVASELISIMKVLHAQNPAILVKAILETCYYTDAQIYDACKMCVDCGVDFVKTSTGFGPGGATPKAVEIMVKAVAGSKTQVKASGGIKTYADAARYIDLGCTRLGSSKYWELLP